MSDQKKYAIGIVVSEHGLLGGMRSWKPVTSGLTIAEAEALSEVLVSMAKAYVQASRLEQVLLPEMKRIFKEK